MILREDGSILSLLLQLRSGQRGWQLFQRYCVAKHINFYTELKNATKADHTALRVTIHEKAKFKTDPIVVSRKFNLRDQQHNERVNDYACDLNSSLSKHIQKKVLLYCYRGSKLDYNHVFINVPTDEMLIEQRAVT